MNVIIIDDMPLAIANLQADIEEYCPSLNIIGTANGVIEGARLLKTMRPDILFLDIHMNDGDGFDLLDIINYESIKVIFTTASKDHALKAFQYAAVDYLLKPIDPTLLSKAVEKVLVSAPIHEAQIDVVKENNETPKIILHTQEEIRVVEIEHIIRCESSNNYTLFYFNDGTKLLVSKTLKEFERMLSEQFLRVHQSHLVNKQFIKSYVRTEGGYLLMKDGKNVPVSVRKKPDVIKAIAEL